MNAPEADEDSDRLRLLRAGLSALEPLFETDRLTLWRILSRSARLVRGLVEEGDEARAEPAWRAHKHELVQGRVVREGDVAYHPLVVDGELVGFLRVSAREVTLGSAARTFLERVLRDMAQALVEPDVPRPLLVDPTEGLRQPARAELAFETAGGGAPHEISRLRALARNNERSLLLRALQGCGWDFAKTARRLGLARSTISRQAKRFEIARPWPSPMDRRRLDD